MEAYVWLFVCECVSKSGDSAISVFIPCDPLKMFKKTMSINIVAGLKHLQSFSGCILQIQLNVIQCQFTHYVQHLFGPGPLFTKLMGVLLQDRVKTRSHEIRVWTFQNALKFDRRLNTSTAKMPVKYQSDMSITSSNFTTLRLYEIWW